MLHAAAGDHSLANTLTLLGHPVVKHLEEQGFKIGHLLTHPKDNGEGMIFQQWVI
jgi:hypothetical protein